MDRLKMTYVERGSSLIARIIVLFLLIGIIGCQTETSKEPANLIGEKVFAEILAEMDLIEAVQSMHSTNEAYTKVEPSAFYSDLWVSYNVTEEQFRTSFEFYQSDLARMSKIYEEAAQILKRGEDQVHMDKKIETGSVKPGN